MYGSAAAKCASATTASKQVLALIKTCLALRAALLALLLQGGAMHGHGVATSCVTRRHCAFVLHAMTSSCLQCESRRRQRNLYKSKRKTLRSQSISSDTIAYLASATCSTHKRLAILIEEGTVTITLRLLYLKSICTNQQIFKVSEHNCRERNHLHLSVRQLKPAVIAVTEFQITLRTLPWFYHVYVTYAYDDLQVVTDVCNSLCSRGSVQHL